jgi:hypothetical protein
MFRIELAGALLLGATVLVGCGNMSGPKASTEMSTDQQTAAALQRSWESTHPGSKAGVVDAVLPARRLASVSNLPVNEIPDGTVISILDQRQHTLVSGVVVAHRGGDVHIRYEALASGERDPRMGDLAVWFPGGPAVLPESVQPGAVPSTEIPMTQPADNMPRENPATTAPPANNPPAESPAPATQPAAPATQPATEPATGGTTSTNPNEPANAAGTTGNTGTTGANQRSPDLNK